MTPIKLIAILLFLLTFSCTSTDNAAKEAMQAKADKVIFDPYQLNIDIEKAEENSYTMVTAIELAEGAHIASPFSNNNWKGLFNISIDDSNNLRIDSTLIETPRSTEEIDSFSGGPVNWIRENTIYQQKLSVLTDSDFEVSGLIQFTIEPRCTLEKTPFTLSYHAGELKIRKIKP